MENKADLRIKAKNIRKGLDIKHISEIACKKISNLKEFQQAKNVMIFYPLEFEVNLLSLISKDKNFYLPRMNGENLEVCPYKKGDTLNLSRFKTQEPITKAISPNILDLIIVPALIVDKNNYRLGYGKGFYDRLISKTKAKTIVPISKELLIDCLPTEQHDKKIDIVILI